MKSFAALLCAAALTFNQAAWAGGTDSLVRVISVVADGKSYVLVVEPSTEGTGNLSFGRCKQFTVHGSYGRLRGEWFNRPSMLSPDNHLQAIAVLRSAAAKHDTLRFGSIGSGFEVIDPAQPCKVRSRALWLVRDEHGTAILSFHNAI